MTRRITPTVLCTMMAALLMLSAAPADMQIAVGMASAHESSAHQPCTSPDCAVESHCPANMSMSDCNMGGMSCSLCGTIVLAHRLGELCIQRGVAVAIQDPPHPILTNRSTSIFHPPRIAS